MECAISGGFRSGRTRNDQSVGELGLQRSPLLPSVYAQLQFGTGRGSFKVHRQSGRHIGRPTARPNRRRRMSIPKRNIDPARCSVPFQFELPVEESSVQLCVDVSLVLRMAVADASASLRHFINPPPLLLLITLLPLLIYNIALFPTPF